MRLLRASGPFRFWAPVAGAALALGAWGLWRLHPSPPARIVLTIEDDPSDGLELAQRRALRDWVQWQLEAAGGAVLTPKAEIPQQLPKGTLLLDLAPRRDQDRLALSWQVAEAEDLSRRGAGAWSRTERTPSTPAEALRALAESLPLPAGPGAAERLLPERPETFWNLVDAIAGNRDTARLAAGYALALQATRDEPGCALAWMVLGDLHYRRMLLAPLSDPMGQAEAEHYFRRALELAPDLPQARFLLAQLKVDSGDHGAALGELAAGLRSHPRAVSLRSDLVYAARTAGLLDLARSALAKVEELVPPGLQANTAENAWLYLGDRARFEASLQTSPGDPRSTVASFYRGYLALADGNAQAAAAWFHHSRTDSNTYSQFAELAEVFERISTGDRAGGLARLQQLADSRVGLRVPDGEFTFKVAEAYALLGENAAAQDTADHAFAQGFGCTAWYEHSPFLGPIRSTPKWRALIAHLRERQHLLERAYPPSAFP
ncbi:MAG TPA: hypothetical protein VL181_09785 [Holophagaceae bacterium]|nr:hypothetical protein [Holophagaceae bacterium]